MVLLRSRFTESFHAYCRNANGNSIDPLSSAFIRDFDTILHWDIFTSCVIWYISTRWVRWALGYETYTSEEKIGDSHLSCTIFEIEEYIAGVPYLCTNISVLPSCTGFRYFCWSTNKFCMPTTYKIVRGRWKVDWRPWVLASLLVALVVATGIRLLDRRNATAIACRWIFEYSIILSLTN